MISSSWHHDDVRFGVGASGTERQSEKERETMRTRFRTTAAPVLAVPILLNNRRRLRLQRGGRSGARGLPWSGFGTTCEILAD